jgi:hypothetical protein
LLKKDIPLVLGPEHEDTFESLTKLAVHIPILSFFVLGYETKIETDVLCNTTGGINLQKQEHGTLKPVGYFSKTMTLTEPTYPIQDYELLTMVDTMKHYEPGLLSTKFFVRITKPWYTGQVSDFYRYVKSAKLTF